MDIQMKMYLNQFVASRQQNLPEPEGVPRELINKNRELAEFQLAVRMGYLQHQEFRKIYTEETAFIEAVLTHLQKLKKDTQKKYGYEVFKILFTQLDLVKLSPEVNNKVQSALDFLERNIDYFCSYTRKGLPDINSSYKQVIFEAFTVRPETHPGEWKEVNFMAKLLVKYLNNHGFNNYFIDTDKIVNGEEIEHTVFDFCERTAVLILLAQQETFRDRRNETNWCYREYDHYLATHAKKHFLVFRSEDLVRPADAGSSILDWYDYVATDKGILGNTIEADCSLAKFKTIINEVAILIAGVKDSMFREMVFSIN